MLLSFPSSYSPRVFLVLERYWNLERFAHVIVEVPKDSTAAQIEVVKDPAGPSELRNVLNHYWFIVLSVTVTGVFIANRNRYLTQLMFDF